MNQLSFEVMGMYTYYVHKRDIMIRVLNHFNYKMMQIFTIGLRNLKDHIG
jgi:hypothetical protein